MSVRATGIRQGWIGSVLAALLSLAPLPATAQTRDVPNFWNTGERFSRPDLANLPRLRFLTTVDFPPFNFIDAKGRLSGFNIDLARAVCEELAILDRCQIQALPWPELEPALARGDGEAIVAGIEIDAARRESLAFSRPFMRVPGRFVGRKGGVPAEPLSATLGPRRVALIAGSGHARWFRIAFPRATAVEFPDKQAALAALTRGEVELVFADALTLSFWLASPASAGCCAYAGGPYLAPDWFGDGLAIAFPRGRSDLVQAADYALSQIQSKGIFAELYLRYFPIGLY